MKQFARYISVLFCLAVPFTGFCKQKPFSNERIQYVIDQLGRYGRWEENIDRGIFTKELIFILDNLNKQNFAVYCGDEGESLYWYENMDDLGEEVKYKLEFLSGGVYGSNSFVLLTKTWPDGFQWYFKMIFKYEKNEWRLDDYILCGRNDDNPARHHTPSSNKQEALKYLASDTTSHKHQQSGSKTIEYIDEYDIYIDGRKSELANALKLFQDDNYEMDIYHFYELDKVNLSNYKLPKRGSIQSIIELTHKKTNARKVIICTSHPYKKR